MCGRYSFSANKAKIKVQFPQLEVPEELLVNYNIAPTQQAYIVTNTTPTQLQSFHWGLVPFWSKDRKSQSKMINARAETAAEKPSFRTPLRQHRCWVLADGFYEWKKDGSQKIPYHIYRSNAEILVMAGIWEIWRENGVDYPTFSILTTAPNQEMASIHDRMPLVLTDTTQQQMWLSELTTEDVNFFLHQPMPDGILSKYPVSSLVNAVKNNGSELQQPIE
jgi:putative SOS response-associated peptidase YedK